MKEMLDHTPQKQKKKNNYEEKEYLRTTDAWSQLWNEWWLILLLIEMFQNVYNSCSASLVEIRSDFSTFLYCL